MTGRHDNHREALRTRESSWQRRRHIEESIRSDRRVTGPVEDLLACSNGRFEEILCHGLPVASGRYYEYLFSCIALTVFGSQFLAADPHADATEHYDVEIAGVKCDFTMQHSEKRKRARDGVILVRFPHKGYHKGTRPKRDMAEIVVDTVLGAGVPATADQAALAKLSARIAPHAY